jgi:hypothetical protein
VVRRQSSQVVLIMGVIPGGFMSGYDWHRFAPWKPGLNPQIQSESEAQP